MIIKTGDAQIVDVLKDEDSLDDTTTRKALNRATEIAKKLSSESRDGNNTEFSKNLTNSENN